MERVILGSMDGTINTIVMMGLETGADKGLCMVRLSKIFSMVLMLASVLTSVLASVDMFEFASFPKWASGSGMVFRDSFVNCASP